MHLPRTNVVNEDALVDRNFAFGVAADPVIRVARIVTNAVRIALRLARIPAHQLLVAVVDAVPVAFLRAIEAKRPRFLAPCTPETDVPAVEGDALAQRIEASLFRIVRNALADADERRERWCRLERRQVDAAQCRRILVVEAGKHDLAIGCVRRCRRAEERIGAGNQGVGVGDEKRRVRPTRGLRQQVPEIDAGLFHAVHREIALECDDVAVRHRRRAREYFERDLVVVGHAEEPVTRHMAELGSAGDQLTVRVAVDAGRPCARLVALRPVFVYGLVVAACRDRCPCACRCAETTASRRTSNRGCSAPAPRSSCRAP